MTEAITLNFLNKQKLNNFNSSSALDVNSNINNSSNQKYNPKNNNNNNNNTPNIINEILKKASSKDNNNNEISEDTYTNLKKESNGQISDCISEEANENIPNKITSQKNDIKYKIPPLLEYFTQKQIVKKSNLKRNSYNSFNVKFEGNLGNFRKFSKDYKPNNLMRSRYSLSNIYNKNSFGFLLPNDRSCYGGGRMSRLSSISSLPGASSNRISEISFNKNKSFVSESSSISHENSFHKISTFKQHLDGNIKLSNQKRLLISTFNYTKSNYLYKETEKMINNIKIYYLFLIIFSVLNIIFSLSDGQLFINNSEKYLLKHNINIHSNNKENKDINIYYLLYKRKISKKENLYRVINGILSIINCFLLIIIRSKSVRFVNIKRQNKKFESIPEENLNNNQLVNQSIQKKNKKKEVQKSSAMKSTRVNLVVTEDEEIVNESVSLSGTKLQLILLCLINIVFYPPCVNKIYIGCYQQIIYVCPLNSIFIIFSFLKIINIYRALIFISPINNIPNKLICKSNLFSLRNRYVIKIVMNTYPILSAVINIIIMFFITASSMYYIEYFSINKNTGTYNNKGDNNFKNFSNVLYLYVFIVKKTAFGDMLPRTLLGKFFIIVFQVIGSFLLAFLFFRLNSIIEFTIEGKRAFSKLEKLFNPENKEYKAASVICKFLKLKKLYKESKSARDSYLKFMYPEKNLDYNKLMDQKFKMDSTYLDNKNSNNDESHYIIFGLKKKQPEIKKEENLELSKIILSDEETEDNKKDLEKKVIFYIENYFILKTQFILAVKDFSDNFKIASNYSVQLTDAIYNLENKLADTTQELSNKLYLIENIDQHFQHILNNQKRILKRFKRLEHFNSYAISYLVAVNNKLYEKKPGRKKKHKGKGKAVMFTTIKSVKKMKGCSKKLTDKQIAEFMPKKTRSGFYADKHNKESIVRLETILEGEEKVDEITKNV